MHLRAVGFQKEEIDVVKVFKDDHIKENGRWDGCEEQKSRQNSDNWEERELEIKVSRDSMGRDWNVV